MWTCLKWSWCHWNLSMKVVIVMNLKLCFWNSITNNRRLPLIPFNKLRGTSHTTYFYFKLSHYIMVKIVIRIIYLYFIAKSAIPFLFLVFWVELLFCLWNNLPKCVVVNKTFLKLLSLITNICVVTQTNILFQVTKRFEKLVFFFSLGWTNNYIATSPCTFL